MIVLDCEQGSSEWFAARLGIPTASMFATVMASGRGGGESKTRKTYMNKLAGERITGEPAEAYTNHHMERGQIMEAEARDLYAFMRDVDPVKVGFVRTDIAGASPDSLIGDNGLLEIKTKLPHLHIDCLIANRLPPDHVAQVQGQLLVCEREWCDFVSYWPKMPPLIVRVERDEKYIDKLASEVLQFADELDELEQTIRAKFGVPKGIAA